jgi:hypothetical protein
MPLALGERPLACGVRSSDRRRGARRPRVPEARGAGVRGRRRDRGRPEMSSGLGRGGRFRVPGGRPQARAPQESWAFGLVPWRLAPRSMLTPHLCGMLFTGSSPPFDDVESADPLVAGRRGRTGSSRPRCVASSRFTVRRGASAVGKSLVNGRCKTRGATRPLKTPSPAGPKAYRT